MDGYLFKGGVSMVAEDMEKNGSLLNLSNMFIDFLSIEVKIFNLHGAGSLFYDIQKVKPRLLELNKKINWIPKHIKDAPVWEILWKHQRIGVSPEIDIGNYYASWKSCGW